MDSSVIRLQSGIRTLLAAAQFTKVISVCTSTLEAARRTESRTGEIASLVGLAGAHRNLGKFHDAHILTEGALRAAHEAGAIDLVSDALIESGFLKLDGSHQPISARDDFYEALKLAHDLNDSRRMSEAMGGIALAWKDLDYPERGLRYAKEAFEQAQLSEDIVALTWALNTLGALLVANDQHDKALPTLHDALNRAQAGDFDIITAHIRINLGYLMLAFAPEDEAGDEYMAEAIQAGERTQCAPLEHAARCGLIATYMDRHQLDRAAEQSNAVLRLADRIDSESYRLNAFLQLGAIDYMREDYDAALAQFERSLLISRNLTNPHYEAMSLQYLGSTHARRQEFSEALRYLIDACSVQESLDNHREVRRLMVLIAWTFVLSSLDRILRLLRLRR